MSLPLSKAAVKPQQRSFWIAVICGGCDPHHRDGARRPKLRHLFQKPIAADLHVGRELWSFANALAMLLMGAFSPFVGNFRGSFLARRGLSSPVASFTVGGMFMIALSATEGVMPHRWEMYCAASAWRPAGVRADLRLHQAGRRRPEKPLGRARCHDPPADHLVNSPSCRSCPLLQSRLDKLAYDDVHRRRDVDGDGAACPRICGNRRAAAPPSPAPLSRKAPRARCRRRSGRKASGCSRSVFLRVRLPRDIHRAPPPLVHFPTRRSACRFFGNSGFGSRTRRLGHRPCRPLQHRRLVDLGMAREPIIRRRTCWRCFTPCGRLPS